MRALLSGKQAAVNRSLFEILCLTEGSPSLDTPEPGAPDPEGPFYGPNWEPGAPEPPPPNRDWRTLLPPNWRRRAWIALAAMAVLATMVFLVQNFFNEDRITSSQAQPAAPIATQSTPPNSLQQVREWFGPWQMGVNNSGDPHAIVMLRSNGALDIASYATAADNDPTWKSDLAPGLDIEATASDTLLRFEGKTYQIKTGQPFILETRPDRVYVVKMETTFGDPQLVSQSAASVHADASKLRGEK